MKIKATIDMDFDFGNLDIDNIAKRELKETASEIEKQAKANVPVATGRLRASIKASISGLEANIGTELEYARFVHDGTYKMEARPFLFSAGDSVLEGIEDRLADDIMRLL